LGFIGIARYALIGHSPLNEITAREVERRARELKMPVQVGMRNGKPIDPVYLTSSMTCGGTLRPGHVAQEFRNVVDGVRRAMREEKNRP
jgi:hypothetical protein